MKRYIYSAFLTLFALAALTACSSDDGYTWAEKLNGEQVYFSNALSSTIELSKAENSVTIPVNRINTNGSVSVPLVVKKGSGSYLNYPSEVTFADGESVANIQATYNPDDIVYGTYVNDTLAIGNEDYTTPYGLSSYSFSFGATEWADITTNGGIGAYREDMMTTFFNVDNVVYNVKIQRSVVTEGVYRIVNPYGSDYPYAKSFTVDTENNHYWVINASNPDAVYFSTIATGMDAGYGEISMTSLAQIYISRGQTVDQIKASHPEWFGKLEDGIITMPERSMLISMADYQNAGMYYANQNGKLAVALPGYRIADYSVVAEYQGRFTDTDNQDYAEYILTFGSDVAKTRSALVAADSWSSSSETILSDIEDGSIKSVETAGSGVVRVPYAETGTYVCVVVIYDTEGNVQGYYATDEQKLRSSSDAVETFTDIAAGIFSMGTADVSSVISESGNAWGLFPEALNLTSPFVQEAVLSQSETDQTHFKLTPFWNRGYDLEFYVEADGAIVVDHVDTGISNGSENIKVTDLGTLVGINLERAKSYGIASYVDGNTYYFNIAYATSKGYYAAETETFVVSETAAKALKAAAKKAKAKSHGSKALTASAHSVKHFIGKGKHHPVRFTGE